MEHSLRVSYSVVICICSFLYNPQVFEVGSILVHLSDDKREAQRG